MVIQIATSDGKTLRTHKCGYGVEREGSKKTKCTGHLKAAFTKLEWTDVANKLEEISTSFYEATRAKGPMEIHFSGAIGDHRSVSVPVKQCVELFLLYEPQGDMAKNPFAVTKTYPGNHGQAIVKMICAEIEHHALKNGPFTSEDVLMAFIEVQLAAAHKAFESATPIAGGEFLSEDDEDEDEDDEGPEETAA